MQKDTRDEALNVLDLFSGIGGFSLGLERAGFKTIAFCETEPYCRDVLRKHWPDVPIHGDIRELDGTQYRGTVDVVCGGWPCQAFSSASRGRKVMPNMWPEYLRIVGEVRPWFVIAENVPAAPWESVRSGLRNLGYDTQTHHIELPYRRHIRKRTYVVAYSDRNRKPRGALHEEMAQLPSDAGILWPAIPESVGMDDGVPRRMDRLRALGNAVIPQIPEIIGRAILDVSPQS